MSSKVTRRFILSGVFGGVASTAFGGAPAVSLRPQVRPDGPRPPAPTGAEVLIREANLGGRVGCAVVDVKSGKQLEGVNARSGQPPASVTKALTALYALDALGPGFRFTTRLRATGPLENGVLQGDLVLAGGGDPSLDTDGLAEMAQQLKEAGVREIKGRFLVYGGVLPFTRAIDEDQPDQVAYNPSVSGLNLNYNRVHFQWKRGTKDYTITMDARTAQYRPDVTVARMLVMDRKGPVYTYTDGGSFDSWTVARKFLGKNGSRWLPVRKPEAYAGEVFGTLARSNGIVLPKPEVVADDPGGRILVTRQSVALPEILREMLKYSTNLTAELVGLMASKARLGQVDSIRASAREMSYWARETLGMKSSAAGGSFRAWQSIAPLGGGHGAGVGSGARGRRVEADPEANHAEGCEGAQGQEPPGQGRGQDRHALFRQWPRGLFDRGGWYGDGLCHLCRRYGPP